MQPTRLDIDHPAEAAGDVQLACLVATPGHHRAVVFQREIMETAGGDRDDIFQTRRHRCLAAFIISPCHHGAVTFQGEAVISSRRDGDHVGKPGRHC